MDLSLVSLEELYDEMVKRTDACIFAYIQSLDNKSEACRIFYSGGKFTSIGLAEAAKIKILDDFKIDLEKDA